MAVLQRGAEVAVQDAAEIVAVLHQHWAVEAHLFPQVGDLCRVGRDAALGQQELRGVAGDDVQQHEDEAGDDPDEHDGRADPPQRVGGHRVRSRRSRW
jgi:hypothetical protein